MGCKVIKLPSTGYDLRGIKRVEWDMQNFKLLAEVEENIFTLE